MNTHNKKLISNDKLYSMPVKSLDVTCALTAYSTDGIVDFVNALNKLYNIDASRSKFVDSMSRAIILHYLLFLIHDSRFLDHLVNLNRRVDLPQFIIVYLAKVTPRVNSKNSLSGFVKGELVNEQDPLDFTQFLSGLTDDHIENILLNSGFNSLNNKRTVREIVSTIRGYCSNFECDNLSHLYDEICSFLSNLPTMFYRNDFAMWAGFLDTNVSTKLGIYRFRNNLEEQFIVNQHSCTKLQEGLLNLFCCFLKIYNPVFLDSEGTPLPHGLVPGEAVLDLSEVSKKDIWVFYLSGTISHGKTSSSPATSSNEDESNRANTRSFSTVRSPIHWAPSIPKSDSFQVISHDWVDGSKDYFLMRDPCNIFKHGLTGLIVYEA